MEIPTEIAQLVAAMTLDEKAAFTAGVGAWSTASLERLGIPAIHMTDGPAGARGARTPMGEQLPGLVIPCGSALGATWDPALVERLGAAVARQAIAKGCRVLLAPTVNLQRGPLGGRNFESYSEDPLLAGKLGAAFVRGAQAEGVACTVKHFAGNEAEFERLTIDVRIDQRALRELHLRAFELTVTEGGALGVMTAYNRLNGAFCSENTELFAILRDDWGFEGFVVTDWYAAGTTIGAMRAGLDIQMPGPDRFYGKPVAAAVRSGELDEALLDEKVGRLLAVFDRLGALEPGATIDPADGHAVDSADDRALARDAAVESIVLLRNEAPSTATQPLLPLAARRLGRIALIGPSADRPRIMGGGSAELQPFPTGSLLEELRSRVVGPEIVFERGCSIDKTVPPLPVDRCSAGGQPGVLIDVFAGEDWSGEALLTTRRGDGRLFVVENEDRGLPRGSLSFRASTTLAPDVSGPHRISIVQIGLSRVLLDGQVVIDGITDPPGRGDAFFGMGSEERVVEIDLDAKRTYDLVVEYRSPRRMWVNGVQLGLAPVPADDLIERAAAAAAASDVAIVVVSTNSDWETEGSDRCTLQLPGDQERLIRAVAAANPGTVVIVNTGAPVDMSWAGDPAAVMQVWFGGQEMAPAIVDVLLGERDPGGRLPHTIPARIEHSPTFGNFPGEHGQVRYGEGVLCGYRWYDARHLPVEFAFGSGLSYASTSAELVSLSHRSIAATALAGGATVDVEVRVVNRSDRRATQVVQCYVGAPAGAVLRPPRELRGFARVDLDPLGSATAVISLDSRAFAHWDPGDAYRSSLEPTPEGRLGTVERSTAGSWAIPVGTFEVAVGWSSAEMVATVPIDVT
jgi:beta-glucosidase